jgi:hypothetical protein
MKRILFPYPVFFLPYPADTADQKEKKLQNTDKGAWPNPVSNKKYSISSIEGLEITSQVSCMGKNEKARLTLATFLVSIPFCT